MKETYPEMVLRREKEANIAQSKRLRICLNNLLQELKRAKRKSKERSVASLGLGESIYWLGKDLKELDASGVDFNLE